MECIFCSIAAGQTKSYKIYEDQDIIAILDIYPANPGHILILPKRHYTSFLELPDNIIGKMFVLAKYLSQILVTILKAEGINIFLASGEIAGQRSPHIILHLIPRYKNDNLKFEWERKQVDENTLLNIQKALLSAINIVSPKRPETKKEEKQEIRKEEKDYSKMYQWFLRKI